jgi:DNA end-binding protein Ku
MLDSRDRTPIRYERINSETGEEVPWDQIVKGFEYAKGSYVVIDEEEIKKAAPEGTETVDIEAFVDRAAISPMYFEKPYYLVPGKKAEKGYVLLREALRKTNRVGIARVVIRTRQYLAALMPLEDALVLNLMRFPQEIVEPDEFKLPERDADGQRIRPQELDMASKLIDSMSTDWDPKAYQDDFRERLRTLVEAQVARETGKKVPAGPKGKAAPKQAATNVVDFMAVLKKSLEQGPKDTAKPRATKPARKGRARKRKAS